MHESDVHAVSSGNAENIGGERIGCETGQAKLETGYGADNADEHAAAKHTKQRRSKFTQSRSAPEQMLPETRRDCRARAIAGYGVAAKKGVQ